MKWLSAGAFLLLALAACDKPKTYKATVEVQKIRRFGQDPKQSVTEMELRFSDCPGNAIKVIRADKSFADCGAKIERGAKVEAEVVLSYSRERGTYRNDITRVAGCEVKTDPKDEANFELVEQCKPVVATGVEVGVHCDRSRNADLVAKCPYLRRR